MLQCRYISVFIKYSLTFGKIMIVKNTWIDIKFVVPITCTRKFSATKHSISAVFFFFKKKMLSRDFSEELIASPPYLFWVSCAVNLYERRYFYCMYNKRSYIMHLVQQFITTFFFIKLSFQDIFLI